MIYDVAILGGSMAGLTAAVYAGRKKLNTIVLARDIGGQSAKTNNIENFPGFEVISGVELSGKIKTQAEKVGVKIEVGKEAEKISRNKEGFFEVSASSGEKIIAKAVIIATGKTMRKMEIPGEQEFSNKGVAFCTICDAPFFSGKDVAVVGGGNSGFESALDLTKYANKIYIMEGMEKMRGDQVLRERLEKTGKVEFMTNVKPLEIKGSNFVEKLIYKDNSSGETKELNIQGVFVNIGWVPDTNFAKDLVKTNDAGEIIIEHTTGKTSEPGIFAAGDAADGKYKQCVIASSQGAVAALSAYEYLIGKQGS